MFKRALLKLKDLFKHNLEVMMEVMTIIVYLEY